MGTSCDTLEQRYPISNVKKKEKNTIERRKSEVKNPQEEPFGMIFFNKPSSTKASTLNDPSLSTKTVVTLTDDEWPYAIAERVMWD